MLWTNNSLVPKELTDRYGEEAAKDLVDRKIKSGQFESNPDFPDREDPGFKI